MKVKELIAELSKFDGDMEVVTWDFEHYGPMYINGADTVRVHVQDYGSEDECMKETARRHKPDCYYCEQGVKKQMVVRIS